MRRDLLRRLYVTFVTIDTRLHRRKNIQNEFGKNLNKLREKGTKMKRLKFEVTH